MHEYPACSVVTAETGAQSGPPILFHSGLPKLYHLLWGAAIPEDGSMDGDSPDDGEGCQDLAGYTCTPLARAYDLFANLLFQHLLDDPATGHVQSGVATRLSARIAQQNGEVAAAVCRRHYDRALSSNQRVCFVWDLVSARAPFERLSGILDASKIPGLAAKPGGRAFQKKHGLPKLLEFVAATPRRPSEIDWFRGVY